MEAVLLVNQNAPAFIGYIMFEIVTACGVISDRECVFGDPTFVIRHTKCVRKAPSPQLLQVPRALAFHLLQHLTELARCTPFDM